MKKKIVTLLLAMTLVSVSSVSVMAEAVPAAELGVEAVAATNEEEPAATDDETDILGDLLDDSSKDVADEPEEPEAANGIVADGDTMKYMVDGQVQDVTDVMKIDGSWYNLVHGVVTPNTVAKNSAGWWAIDENGMVDFDFTGFAENPSGIWYCKGGKVDFGASGIFKDNKTLKYGYVVKGKLQLGKVDVQKNSAGWWYIGTDGYVDFTANTVAKNSKGWWVIQNGKVNFNYNGLASNQNGTYKITKGQVTFKDNGVIKVGNTWYNFVKSKVTAGPTLAKNSSGWWYIDKTGKVDFTFQGLAKNSAGTWYCEKGKVRFDLSGLFYDCKEIYRVTKGKVTRANYSYVNASDAYTYLNNFRTGASVWAWNSDNKTKTVYNQAGATTLAPLKRSAALEESAKLRAKDIVFSFSHTRPDGNSCFEVYPDMWAYGENIAYGYQNSASVTEGWKETNYNYSGQGHRRNMLNSRFNAVGIAGLKIDGTIYWVQCFGYVSE